MLCGTIINQTRGTTSSWFLKRLQGADDTHLSYGSDSSCNVVMNPSRWQGYVNGGSHKTGREPVHFCTPPSDFYIAGGEWANPLRVIPSIARCAHSARSKDLESSGGIDSVTDRTQKGDESLSICTSLGFRQFQESLSECMAGTMGLESATSVVICLAPQAPHS
jgi:hypothetical protein